MLGLKVALEFECGGCGRTVGITVQCAGSGLGQGANPVAAVHVPCPHCGSISQVCFEPGGTIRDVRPCRAFTRSLEPSVN